MDTPESSCTEQGSFVTERTWEPPAAGATKARLEQTRIIAAANKSAGRTVVRALRILAPGTVAAPEPADSDPELSAAPAGPRRTRETASDGYRRGLAAHQEAAPSRVDPHIAEAVERQTSAMRELSRRAFASPTPSRTMRRPRSSRPAPSAGTVAAPQQAPLSCASEP